MIILTDNNNVLIAIGDEVIEDVEEQGVVWINGAGYGLDGQQIYESVIVPEYVVPYKYKYVDGAFILNEEYTDPNQDFYELQRKVAEQDMVIEELIFEIIPSLMGGI
jgi:hypothetical protein